MDASGPGVGPAFEPQPPSQPASRPQPPGWRGELSSAVAVLWGRRRFLFRLTLAGIAISVLISFVLPKRFEATMQIMPPESKGSKLGLGVLAVLGGSSGGGGMPIASDLLEGGGTSGAVYLRMLESRTVLDRVVDRMDLKKVYGAPLYVIARERLKGKTEVAEDRKSGVISVTVSDRDAKRAAGIAQAYFEEMNRRLAELNTSAAHRERVFLEERLKSVKLELDDAARQFSQFASKNVTLDVPAQGKAMVEAAAQLQGEMIAAESQARGLEQIYTANNVRVRAARARVDELKRQLGELRGKTPGTQPAGSNQGFPSIRELPVLGVTYSDLYRRVKVEEAVFEALTKQYEMARVEEAKELPSVRLMDAPVVPERKAGPSRRLIVYLGTVISLFLGSVWVLGAALWQGTDQNILWKKLLLQAWDNVRQTTLYARCQRILARFRRKPATAAE